MNSNVNLEEAVREVLESLGRVNRLFRDAASRLKRLPQVESVATALEVMNYENGPCVEGYIDAELRDGNGVSWRFDVTWDADYWHIRGTLERNSALGNEVMERIPPEIVPRSAGLPEALARTAEQLLRLRSKEVMIDSQ
jgi:hypothetical protein